MSWIIIKQPHPLDRIWSKAMEDIEQANAALDALDTDFSDAEVDAAKDRRTEAMLAIMALPARSVSDSAYKLDLAGIDGGHLHVDCDAHAIMEEMISVLDAAIGRGKRLVSQVPGLLEGVAHDAAA